MELETSRAKSTGHHELLGTGLNERRRGHANNMQLDLHGMVSLGKGGGTPAGRRCVAGVAPKDGMKAMRKRRRRSCSCVLMRSAQGTRRSHRVSS